MGVDFYTCIECNQTSSDCGDYEYCESCDKFICETCAKTCKIIKNHFVCTICKNDEITEKQLLIIAKYLLEKSSFNDLDEVREFLRTNGQIDPPFKIKCESESESEHESESEREHESESEHESGQTVKKRKTNE